MNKKLYVLGVNHLIQTIVQRFIHILTEIGLEGTMPTPDIVCLLTYDRAQIIMGQLVVFSHTNRCCRNIYR